MFRNSLEALTFVGAAIGAVVGFTIGGTIIAVLTTIIGALVGALTAVKTCKKSEDFKYTPPDKCGKATTTRHLQACGKRLLPTKC